MHYTWSKNIDNIDNMADNQGFHAGGTVGNHDLYSFRNNRHLRMSEIPHRFVATLLYQTPFSRRGSAAGNRFVRAIVGGSILVR